MKVLIGLVIVIAIGLGAVYFFGGYESLSVEQQAKNFRAQVKPGMTWQQVAKVKEPRELKAPDAGSLSGYRSAGKYDPSRLESQVSKGSYSSGFVFQYKFGPGDAVEVIFDPQGVVTRVRDMYTVKDLYDGKLPGGL